MSCLSRGWQCIYFPHPLSRGLAPATLAGVYRQRFQWCLDTMRLFFWDNPLWKSGLNWPQKRHFLIVMLSYLASGLVFPIFYSLPLLVYWRGHSCLQGYELPYGVLRLAYLAATVLMFHYLFFHREPLKQFKMLCSLFPVHALAIGAALFYPPGRKPAYRVNNRLPFAEAGRWWHWAPHVGLIIPHLTLPLISLWQGWASARAGLLQLHLFGWDYLDPGGPGAGSGGKAQMESRHGSEARLWLAIAGAGSFGRFPWAW